MALVRIGDFAGVAALLANGWPTQWDREIDEMTYAGREADLETLRQIVQALRAIRQGPVTAESVRQLLG